jgi:MarR family transcriptional regulator, organic hydroperoxide resistance regulator
MQKRIEQEHRVTQQLRIIFKAIQAHSKRVEKTCGLSSVRLWMLYEISQNPGVTVSELAALLSIHRSTCSNMLDKLEDQDLIYRTRSKTDQRTVRLHITDTGQSILARAPSPPEGKLSSSLHKLTEEQLANLDDGLKDLIDVLHFDDEKAGLTPIQGP